MTFEGSRNFCSEQVHDMIWQLKAGTKITVDILDDKVVVSTN